MQGFAGLFLFRPPFFDLRPAENVFRRYFSTCFRGGGLIRFRSGEDGKNRETGEASCIVDLAGRIHNAADIRDEVGTIKRDFGPTDPQLIAKIYGRRGWAGFSALAGDFSFALYDGKKRDLILVRDPMGARPLFYHRSAEFVAWSTEVEPLVELTSAPVRLDEEYVGAFLYNADLVDRTPYAGILKVPPGHAGRFNASGTFVSRYWDAACFECDEGRQDGEYEQRFFDLFASAVKCRLPQTGAATAELSGGLDSSSIVGMCDHLTASGETASETKTASMIFDRSRTANEENYIAAVEAARGQATFRILESEHPLFRFSLEQRRALPNQKYPLERIYRRLGRYVEDENSAAHLCGLGGDQVLWSRDLFYPPAHLSNGKSGMKFSAALRTWGRSEGMNYYQLLRAGRVVPALPYGIRKRLDFGGFGSPPFLRKDLAMHLRERQLQIVTQVHPRHLTPVQLRKLMLLGGAAAISAGCRHREFLPIEATFPFLDTRLVRFLMNVPAEQLFRPGESRSLQRRALKSLLPEKVRNREEKRGPDEALCRALREQWGTIRELMKDSYAASLPGIDGKELGRSIDLARCGAFHWIGALPSIVCLEVWIRSRAGAQLPSRDAAAQERPRSQMVLEP